MFSYMSVCLSVINMGSHVTITNNHYIGTPCHPWPIPPPHWTWDLREPPAPAHPADIWWLSLETCSDLFTSGHPLPSGSWHLVAVETGTVGKCRQYAYPIGMLSCVFHFTGVIRWLTVSFIELNLRLRLMRSSIGKCHIELLFYRPFIEWSPSIYGQITNNLVSSNLCPLYLPNLFRDQLS